MKYSLLDVLACPACGSDLSADAFKQAAHKVQEIIDGLLRCRRCPQAYPVIAGIPRFVPNALDLHPQFARDYPQAASVLAQEQKRDFVSQHGSTQERFGMEWLRYPGSMAEDRDVFLYETQIAAADWRGKKVLDAGCGMGRYSRVAHALGAEVVAVDLGPAVVRLWDLATESERMHVVQGNLMSPPFKPGAFDTVYSVGVIHHTPSARAAFENLGRLVRTGGQLSVWVYGAPGRFHDFKSNPLRPDRQGLKKAIFLVWLVVLVRELLSDALRLATVRVPHKLLYALCYPLAWIGKLPLVQYLTFSVHPDWRVRLQENFDWLTPPYQSHHTKEELIGWFEGNGFDVLKVLPHGFVPKPGVLGKKR